MAVRGWVPLPMFILETTIDYGCIAVGD